MKQNKAAAVSGVVTTPNEKIVIDLFVMFFEDGGSQIAYCPALNIYGYGTSEEEARASFETCLSEFFSYTTNKKTLVKELESLGWTIKKEKRFTAPAFTKLLESNRDLRKILDTKDIRKINRSFSIPAIA